MASTSSFVLLALHVVSILSMNGVDIGCNYVNMGGIGVSTEFCMTVPNTTYALQLKCNGTYNGINLQAWVGEKCDGVPVSMSDFTQNVADFYCDPAYDGILCPDVSLKTYPGSECIGSDYDELRLIIDECFYAAPGQYVEITCNSSEAEYSLYSSSDCDMDSFLNTTLINEGTFDGESAGCIAVDGCDYNPTTTQKPEIILQDIGCNYMNAAGIGIPLNDNLCVHGQYRGMEWSVKLACNQTYNGVAVEMWLGDECRATPQHTQDMTGLMPDFFCKESYEGTECETVTLEAYTDDSCSGAPFAQIQVIPDKCLYVDADSYLQLTCSPETDEYMMATYSSKECDSASLVNLRPITHASFSMYGQNVGCMDAYGGGCGGGQFSTTQSATSDTKKSHTSMTTVVGIFIGAVCIFVIVVIIFFSKKKQSAQIAHVQLDGGDNLQRNEVEFVESANHIQILSINSEPGGIQSVATANVVAKDGNNEEDAPYHQMQSQDELDDDDTQPN